MDKKRKLTRIRRKDKRQITQIVDVDKGKSKRFSGEAENVVDDAKIRIEKIISLH